MIRWCLFTLCVLPFWAFGEGEPLRVVLEPRFHTEMSSEVTTTVAAINKRMGDSFVKGDVLMALDDVVFRSNVAKEKSILERAKAELRAQQQLYDDKAASLLDLKDAEAKLKVAEADLAKADKELASCTLVAPYDGTVQDVKVQEYEHVEPGKPLMDILDDHILVAKLLVPSQVGIRLKAGQALNIQIPEAGGTFAATITHIAPGIDPASDLLKVDSEIKNDKHLLRPGMIGTIDLTSYEPKDHANRG